MSAAATPSIRKILIYSCSPRFEAQTAPVSAPAAAAKPTAAEDPTSSIKEYAPLAGGLPVPAMLQRVFRTDKARSTDPETRALVEQFLAAVRAEKHKTATGLADKLVQRAAKGPKDNDSIDEIHIAFSEGQGKVEDKDAIDWLLVIFTLGVAALVDALGQTDYEALLAKLKNAREAMSLPIALRIAAARDGATKEDTAVLARELAKLPPAILRIIEMQGSRFYAVRNDAFHALDQSASGGDHQPSDPKVLGAYDWRTNQGNVLVKSTLLGGSQIDGSAFADNVAMHEALHAYDDATNASARPAFRKALAADGFVLPEPEGGQEAFDAAAEHFAHLGSKYLDGDHAMKQEHPAVWAFMVATFGPR